MGAKGGYQIIKWKLQDWDSLCLICSSCCIPLSNKQTQINGLAQPFSPVTLESCFHHCSCHLTTEL